MLDQSSLSLLERPATSSPLRRVVLLSSEEDLAAWDAFVVGSPEGSVYQCTWWSRPLERYGVATRVLAWHEEGRLIGGLLLRQIPIPGSPFCFLRAIGGPIADPWEPGLAAELVEALGSLALDTRAIYTEFQEIPSPAVHGELRAQLAALRHSVRTVRGPLRAIIDLDGVEPGSVSKLFNKGTRWSVKRGRKAGIQVRDLRTPEELQAAYACWRASSDRQKICDLRPWPAVEPLVRQCLEAKAGWLIGGYLEDRLLSAIFVATLGAHPLYLYGGYVDDAEQHFPNHLLQEEVILRCLEAGLGEYDMGSLTPFHATAPRGIDQFKLGFGVAVSRHLDTIIWPNKPFLAWLFFSVKTLDAANRLIRWFKRKLFRQG